MTLHQTVEDLHKAVKYGIVLSIFGIILLIFFRIGSLVWFMFNPPPPDLPNTKFGKLKVLPFPAGKVTGDFIYVLDTINGVLPVFPDRINVYKMKQPGTSLLNITQARNKIKGIGFENSLTSNLVEIEKSQIEYRWEITGSSLRKSIDMDIETFNFQFRTSYKEQPEILQPPTNETRAAGMAYDFLNAMRFGFSDLDRTKVRTEYLALQNGTLTPVQTFDQSQIIRVDLYQMDVDELGIYYPDYPYTPMNFLIMSRGNDINDVLEANVSHQEPILEKDDPKTNEKIATYPIITAEEAYKELQEGKAYISNYFGTSKTIKITDISLGYYIGSDRQEYLLPIIVFSSNKNFYAFVPAVRTEWVE